MGFSNPQCNGSFLLFLEALGSGGKTFQLILAQKIGPRQARLSSFPKGDFGKQKRSFNPGCFDSYLSLNIVVPRMLMFTFNADSSKPQTGPTFTTFGFKKWEKIEEKL